MQSGGGVGEDERERGTGIGWSGRDTGRERVREARWREGEWGRERERLTECEWGRGEGKGKREGQRSKKIYNVGRKQV